MNEIKEKRFVEIIEDLQNCKYVLNDEIAHHCLKLSSGDIRNVIEMVSYHLEIISRSILDDELVSYKFKSIQEKIKIALTTLEDLRHIERIIRDSENACKCEYYEECDEDENGEMIYRCLDCDSTFYKYDD